MIQEDVFLYKGTFVVLQGIGPRYATVRYLDGSDRRLIWNPDGSAHVRMSLVTIRPSSPRPSDPADYQLERPERIPFAIRVELAAIRHYEDVEDTWFEAYCARLPPYEPLPLTNQQVDFMVKYHGDIERANFHPDLESFAETRHWTPKIVGDVLSRRTFRRVFGSMLWDEAFDRYEEHQAYDSLFRALLHYAYALAQGLGGWALAVHMRGYDPVEVPLLLEFEAAYPDTFDGLVANAGRIESSLKRARDYDADLDAFYHDAAEKVRRFRAETTSTA